MTRLEAFGTLGPDNEAGDDEAGDDKVGDDEVGGNDEAIDNEEDGLGVAQTEGHREFVGGELHMIDDEVVRNDCPVYAFFFAFPFFLLFKPTFLYHNQLRPYLFLFSIPYRVLARAIFSPLDVFLSFPYSLIM